MDLLSILGISVCLLVLLAIMGVVEAWGIVKAILGIIVLVEGIVLLISYIVAKKKNTDIWDNFVTINVNIGCLTMILGVIAFLFLIF